ncbi:signal peptidase complex subunit 1 [Harmonia axyridis]|uniref:signal peptidase complex subunit 1 n=1 Tax=Harmonia axyridis TaxID=115357 RepID=UPI001E277066|nr:signal peptidase complex subunit 1 [Harmonia axyridis]
MLEFVDNWHMDYVGQAWAEKLSRIIITLFGVIGVLYGYAIQQFSMTVYILGAGFALASLVTIPPWPMYRKNPLNWQPVKNKENHSKKIKKNK